MRKRPRPDQIAAILRDFQADLDAVLAAAARFTERTNRQHAEFQAATRDAGGISAALHAFAG